MDEKYGIKDDNNEEKEWRLILGKSSFEYTMNLGYQSVIIRAQENQKVDGQPIKETLYCSNPVQFDLGGTPPTVTPGDPEVPDPDPTDPENPDPENPDPENPDPENPDPEDPGDPGEPDQPYIPPEVPKTGDNSHPTLYLTLMAISGVVLVLLLWDRRQEKKR